MLTVARLTRLDFQLKARFINLRGLNTRYLTAGNGPALLLVHPVGYPAEVFAHVMPRLAHHFTLIAPDLPGQGHSQAPADWDGAPQNFMAEHLLALADQLEIDRFAVLGSSLGGLIAALVALRAPARVAQLILVGTGSVFNLPASQPQALQAVYDNGSRAYADPSLDSCRQRLANTCHRMPAADDILLTQITAYALPGVGDAYRRIIEGVAATITDPACNAYDHLEALNTPTLVVVGTHDKRTSVPAHAAGVARMPNARLAEIDQCGHLPFLEYPETFASLTLEFLGSPEHRAAARRSQQSA